MANPFQRAWDLYKLISAVVVGAAVVALAGNLVFGFTDVEKASLHERPPPIVAQYGAETLYKAYPHRTPADVDALLRETWNRRLIYAPLTQFREQPHKGKYVNVSEEGFRHSPPQGPWPPDPEAFNVFMFGGSTLFGYGVADDETVPSQLQRWIGPKVEGRVHVYNFGQGFYFLTQERILFEQLLAQGAVPDLAVFVDGVNDFYHGRGEPEFTNALRSTWRPDLRPPPPVDIKTEASARRVIDRYLQDKKLIEAVALAFDVKTAFVFQPSPSFGYESDSFLFGDRQDGDREAISIGYRLMDGVRQEQNLGPNFFWCVDVHTEVEEPHYVDGIHYSATLSEALGRRIGERILAAGLLAPAAQKR